MLLPLVKPVLTTSVLSFPIRGILDKELREEDRILNALALLLVRDAGEVAAVTIRLGQGRDSTRINIMAIGHNVEALLDSTAAEEGRAGCEITALNQSALTTGISP